MKRICGIKSVKIQTILEIPTVKPTQCFTQRENPYNELAFYISGSDRVEFGDNVHITKAGMVKFQPKKERGIKHTITNLESVKSVDIFFEADGELPSISLTSTFSDHAEIKSLFLKAAKAWQKRDTGYLNKCTSIFYRILYLIEKNEEGASPQDGDILSPAIEYIHANYLTAKFPYSEMPALCGISGSYFRRLFLKRFDCTLIDYIRRLKMNHACELLNSSQYKSIADVAKRCGYEDVFYFSKVFKSHVGVSPGKYMK